MSTIWIPISIGIIVVASYVAHNEIKHHKNYTVEHFTADLTIRIQCSGDCDLDAMIAEAREATEK